jgi:hypothetical protein
MTFCINRILDVPRRRAPPAHHDHDRVGHRPRPIVRAGASMQVGVQTDLSGQLVIYVHSDPAVIDRALDNPLIKFAAAVWGTPAHAGVARRGYATRLLPAKMSGADIDDVLGKVRDGREGVHRRHAGSCRRPSCSVISMPA